MKRYLHSAVLLLLVSACASTPSGGGSSGGASSGGSSSGGTGSSPFACNSNGTYTSSFACMAPGRLLAGTGQGTPNTAIAVEGLRFPLKNRPAFLNSQVYRYQTEPTFQPSNPGPDGSPMGQPNNTTAQCDSRNYSFPWQDNFCENRSGANASCQGGQGHAGADIRGPVCATDDQRNRVVAAEAGKIIEIAPHFTKEMASGETHYFNYMHMATRFHSNGDLAAAGAAGIPVARGADLGNIGNLQKIKNGSPVYTTRHLHFEIRGPILIDGSLVGPEPTPPYTALVDAYRRLESGADN